MQATLARGFAMNEVVQRLRHDDVSVITLDIGPSRLPEGRALVCRAGAGALLLVARGGP